MNNLGKMLAALMVATVGLGLAPTAAADFACSPDQTLTPNTPDNSRTLSSGGARTYEVDASLALRILTIEEATDGDEVKVSIWRYDPNATNECIEPPVVSAEQVDLIDGSGTDGESESFVLPLGFRYLVKVEDAQADSASETFSAMVE